MDLIYSYQEKLQDTFFIKFLLDIKRRVQNKETKNYLIEFIKDIAATVLYEIAVFFDKQNILSKADFFISNMSGVVRERRQWIKKPATDSSELKKKAEKMGINFSQHIYDLNLIINNNKLLATNFENFDCKNDLDFVDGVLRAIEVIPQSSLSAIGFDSNEIRNLYSQFINDMDNIVQKCEKAFSGKRFAYSAYKLFSANPNLTADDKIFILQRYRLVSSIFKIERLFPKNIVLRVGPFELSFKNFIRKYKAIIIETLGNDLKNPKSNYLLTLCSKIDTDIKMNDFFKINRKLRDNVHYDNIEKLSEREISCLNKYQNIYLKIMLDSFNENLYVKIDKEDINMTRFLSYNF